VLDSIENAIGLPPEALANSRDSMRENGNVSSVSVLDVLRRTIADSPPAGTFGLMVSMGPGFSFELVLLSWWGLMAYYLFILAIDAERLVELAVAKRNAEWSFAHGGKEFGRGH
jgi:hypothetical protein